MDKFHGSIMIDRRYILHSEYLIRFVIDEVMSTNLVCIVVLYLHCD